MTLIRPGRFAGGLPQWGDGPFWEDLTFPATGLNPPGAVSDPDRDPDDGTLLFDAGSTEIIVGVAQMRHRWIEGSTIHPHIHWGPTSTNTGNVLWRLSYSIADVDGVFPAYETLDVTAAAGGSDDAHLLTEFGEIDMTGFLISVNIKWKVARIGGDAADTYADDAKLYDFDIHYRSDRPGSRQEYVK